MKTHEGFILKPLKLSVCLKQVDNCTLGRPVFVTFSDIYIVKIESNVVMPIEFFIEN